MAQLFYRCRSLVESCSIKRSPIESGKVLCSVRNLCLLGLIVLVCWCATLVLWNTFRPSSDSNNVKPDTKNKTDAVAVTVTVYYETYCPDCEDFIITHLYPVHASMREKVVVDLVPYGKAEQSQVNGEIEIKCQHGKVECEGNKLHACAVRVACGDRRPQDCPWDRRTRLMEFVYCNLEQKDHVRSAEQCAEKAGLEANEMMMCANSREGNMLLSAHGNRTAAYRPRIAMNAGSVPSIAIDGVPSIRAERDLLGEICKLRPSLC